MNRLKTGIILVTAIVFFTLAAFPSMAIAPPSEEDREWLRTAPDLQDRIDFANSVLEPLLNPDLNTSDFTVNFYTQDIEDHFGSTPDDEDYSALIDLNNDDVIDERDFIELAFIDKGPKRHAESPSSGSVSVIVIPIKFPDTNPSPDTTPEYMLDFLFSPDHYSAQTYYAEVSKGLLDFNGIIITNPEEGDGWWMADLNKHDYNDTSLMGEILEKADPYYDFSNYDADGNSEVDGTVFLYAGDHDNWGDFYWGWAGYGQWIIDDVRVGPMMFVGENMLSPSLIVHEYGHMMGIPDFYDYTGQSSGIGKFGMMAYAGHTYMSAWTRVRLGWDEPINVQIDTLGAPMLPRSAGGPVYRVWHQGEAGPEYFLVEGIDKNGMDGDSPGTGIAIYHIDETVHGNNNWEHKQVDVEEADGLDHLDSGDNSGEQQDLYYSGGNQTFNSLTYPNSVRYTGESTLVQALNLTNTEGDLIVGYTEPVPLDETEPNNTWDDVGVIELPPPNGITDGFAGFDGDVSDYWAFTVDGPKVLEISLDAYTEICNLTLVLYAVDGMTPIYVSESSSGDEYIRTFVDGPGMFFIEVRAESYYSYYDLVVDVTDYGDPGDVQVIPTDILPNTVYDRSSGIPVLKLEILNNAGPITVSKIQAYYQGTASGVLEGIDVWLGDGDHVFGPGLDVKLNPSTMTSITNKFFATGMDQVIGKYAVIYITVNLLDTTAGNSFSMRIPSYKDIEFSSGTVPYGTYPINSGTTEIFDAPMPLCYVGGGEFHMGTDPGSDPYFNPDQEDYRETPQHLHPVNDYYISRNEITCAQYIDFMDGGGYSNSDYWDFGWDWIVENEITTPGDWPDHTNGPDFPDYPVGGTSWFESMAYAKSVGGRLPTEAEWEKACRGTDGRLYSWGNVYDGSLYTRGWPTPVGSKPGSDSPYGVADMTGNICEWTRDGFEWYVYNRYANGSFYRPYESDFYMVRSYPYNFGNGEEDVHITRAAFRYPTYYTYRWILYGFRVVFDPPG